MYLIELNTEDFNKSHPLSAPVCTRIPSLVYRLKQHWKVFSLNLRDPERELDDEQWNASHATLVGSTTVEVDLPLSKAQIFRAVVVNKRDKAHISDCIVAPIKHDLSHPHHCAVMWHTKIQNYKGKTYVVQHLNWILEIIIVIGDHNI